MTESNQMVKKGLHVVVYSDPLTCKNKLCSGTIKKVIQESGVYEGYIVYNVQIDEGTDYHLQYDVLSTVKFTV